MEYKEEKYEVEFTEECISEIESIYEYISTNLLASKSARELLKTVNKKVLNLTEEPEMYMKIGKADKLKREYHRLVVKNYIVLYTIDYEKKKVYISRMIYGKRNY